MASSQKVSAVLVTREDNWPADVPVAKMFPFDEVIIETRCTGVHRRWELALQAKNDVVYVQDDDAMLDIRKLWAHYDERMTYAITQGHKEVYDGLCDSKVCLIGWGCFFPRDLTEPTRWSPYVERFGAIPSHEADRVFTFFARPHQAVVMPITHLYRPHAMCRDNTAHYISRNEMIAKLMELDV